MAMLPRALPCSCGHLLLMLLPADRNDSCDVADAGTALVAAPSDQSKPLKKQRLAQLNDAVSPTSQC
jgi:hypothetical protein